MGGTKILAGALNSEEGVITRIKKATNAGSSQNDYVKNLAELVSQITEDAGIKSESVKAVCLGVPGSLNPYTGMVNLAPNIGLKNYNLKEHLQEKIPYPVLIENDVNLGALGVKKFGTGKNAKNMLAVFVGTGIGGALFFENKIYRGSGFGAGEIGHIVVKKDGPLCGCGNHGCFETLASRSAIVKSIEKDLKAKKKSIIVKYSGANKPIKSKAIAAALKADDKLVKKHVSEACETIGLVLANVNNLLNVDLIVLGGGLLEAASKFMIPLIRSSFEEYALKDAAKIVKIVSSKLGDDAALYGGLALAEEFLDLKI